MFNVYPHARDRKKAREYLLLAADRHAFIENKSSRLVDFWHCFLQINELCKKFTS